MGFSDQLRRRVEPIWKAQLTHPFVVSLGRGTLPLRKFQFYILQDARFLEELARVFALGVQKATNPEVGLRFAKLVEETITVERGLHENYGKKWKLSTKAMRQTPMAPTNYAYTHHMRSVAQQGSLCELIVVTLPCAWVYCVIGQHLLRKGAPSAKHPYRDWLMMYGSPEFAEVGEWMRQLVDTLAKKAGEEEKKRMREAFLLSSRYEWMFWDMAWKEESWPV